MLKLLTVVMIVAAGVVGAAAPASADTIDAGTLGRVWK